jgi:vacuolar iron transporter family protein
MLELITNMSANLEEQNKKASRIGFGFGATSGVITTLGLLVGLAVSTDSRLAVVSGILTIAVADGLSDAFGIHISQESSGEMSDEGVWRATIVTFFSKLVFALSFLVPVLLLELSMALVFSVIWGLLQIGILTYFSEKASGRRSLVLGLLEHLAITIFVLAVTYGVGFLVGGLGV